MKFIISLDQGTTSSRSILFNSKGEEVYVAQKEFKQFFPKSGWVEHDPNEIISTQMETLREVIHHSKKLDGEVIALGITNQRETIVAWQKSTGKAIYNAIVWQDTRTSDFCRTIKESYGDLIKKSTGLIVDSYFSGSKAKWILDNVEEASQLAEAQDLAFGTIDSWLIWNLTDGMTHATDVSNASRTMLFDIHELSWKQELLDIFGIPAHTLPKVMNSSDQYGSTLVEGLAIPICSAIGDQQAALFGQCCFTEGQAKNTYGTGCFMLLNTGKKPVASNSGLLSTVGWRIGKETTYALEGSVFVAGAAIQWLRDGLKILNDASESEALALSAGDTSELIVVPAFAGLGAPYWDMFARGAILGITRDTGRAEITKATLESLALQVRDVLLAMTKDSKIDLASLNVDGGASSNNFLMQFQSDVLNKPIDRPVCKESTALGAAFLAGIEVGLWTLNDLVNIRKSERVFNPQMENNVVEQKVQKWNKAIERVKNWVD
ncbi:glycerol kinase GlpK [Parvicella tangerina]|uniref:Glycerol kinase n=1 Tax=Parvicella tangerina TaxID=2829795 RepID=A0A916NGJ0_9FLAO|nr:glycerol kinase GlpK [Parvicella tangerina]CAG5079888.1 Glycerol kinase [Parvicella tangerina]